MSSSAKLENLFLDLKGGFRVAILVVVDVICSFVSYFFVSLFCDVGYSCDCITKPYLVNLQF